MLARLDRARGVPAMVMIDYARLAEVEPPEGMHLALVDPPASQAEAAWAAHRAAGRWLHLAWSEGEVDLALAVAEEEWELRPAVTAVGAPSAAPAPCRGAPASSAPSWATAPPAARPRSRPAPWACCRRSGWSR